MESHSRAHSQSQSCSHSQAYDTFPYRFNVTDFDQSESYDEPHSFYDSRDTADVEREGSTVPELTTFSSPSSESWLPKLPPIPRALRLPTHGRSPNPREDGSSQSHPRHRTVQNTAPIEPPSLLFPQLKRDENEDGKKRYRSANSDASSDKRKSRQKINSQDAAKAPENVAKKQFQRNNRESPDISSREMKRNIRHKISNRTKSSLRNSIIDSSHGETQQS